MFARWKRRLAFGGVAAKRRGALARKHCANCETSMTFKGCGSVVLSKSSENDSSGTANLLEAAG
jgi:hypothetical protein